ncbi:MAG TPA: glucokinase [Arenimonas sp.]|nr:glucokinase [Arenimonas sp.]
MTATSNTHALVADIGGTNARFALADLTSAHPVLTHSQSLPTAGFASLQHAVEHYLASVGAKPRFASFAVACPVLGDDIRLTNRAWAFSRRELQETLALERLTVINDFGAAALAVLEIGDDRRVCLHGGPDEQRKGPITVIGPGTGLGIALLVGDDKQGWRVVETEGGHVSFAPQVDEERMITDWVSARHGRCSNERLLSGLGLSYIDAAISDPQRTDLRNPADIVAAALEGHDVMARRALARFCAIFGSVAGDAALIHGARTVAIAGGIVPRFIPFLRSSAFRERFLSKGRFAAYLESVSVHVVIHESPGLVGAAVALKNALET